MHLGAVPAPGRTGAQHTGCVSVRVVAFALTLLALSVSFGGVTPADAFITDVQTIDGPETGLLDLGGIAMAEDGTGGIVFRRRAEGRAHIYAARYANGRWYPPRRVDVGQPFDSSWPRIAAGRGGRLMVVWVQEFGDADRLYSATIDPGEGRFEPPVPVDLNVRDATATYPSLAMAPGGQALVSYVVVTQPPGVNPNIPAGYARAEWRLAAFRGGLRWSSLGRVNRNPETPVPVPDEGSAPRVALDSYGNGVIAFREPDDALVNRVWARRVFSSSTGVPLQASPATIDGRPVAGDADQFAVGIGGLGEVAVAYRQLPGPGEAALPRLYVNTIPAVFTEQAAVFAGPVLADGESAPGPAKIGRTRVEIPPEGSKLRVAYDAGGTTVAVDVSTDSRTVVGSPLRLGGLDGATAGPPLIDYGRRGATVLARSIAAGSSVGVELREIPFRGSAGVARFGATVSGPIRDVALDGSGLGDALLAFLAGSDETGEIRVATVDAPPQPFAVNAPTQWIRPTQARVDWEPAPDAIGPIVYQPLLDGRRFGRERRSRAYRFDRRGLEDGTYKVRVRGTDRRGQSVLSFETSLKVDGTPPRIRILPRAGRRVAVRIVDGGTKGRRSGVDPESTRVVWGDGDETEDGVTARHRYARRRRTVQVTVSVRDRAGNVGRATRKVRIR